MVLLSFDIEEFDVPMEYGTYLPFKEQMHIAIEGTVAILDLLDKHGIKATFFCTANFAIHAKDVIRRMVESGHEIASHGYYHSGFSPDDLAASKATLERITEKSVLGFRMPRMMPVDDKKIYKAGYLYNSSLNPTWIPGRYNNLSKPRKLFQDGLLFQLPASVSPLLRFPLFWLSFHNLPMWLYRLLCNATYKKDQYLNIYFHPWEFTDLDNKRFGLPGYMKKNTGEKMIRRMDEFLTDCNAKGMAFGTILDFLLGKNTKLGEA